VNSVTAVLVGGVRHKTGLLAAKTEAENVLCMQQDLIDRLAQERFAFAS
jgi:hypothetical protein